MNAIDLARARGRLRHYESNIRRLHELMCQAVLMKSSTDYLAQRYRIFRPSGGVHSDPVSRRYVNIESLEDEIATLYRKVQPVIEEYRSIKNSSHEGEREMFMVLERGILGGEPLEGIAATTGKSSRTLYRRRYELMCRVATRIREMEEENGGK